MAKLTIVPSEDNLNRFMEHLDHSFGAAAGISEDLKETITLSSREVFLSICRVDKGEGMLIISVDISVDGVGVQFMHAGALFNPLRQERCPYTHEHMDEISFEFKYGRNMATIFKHK